MRKIITRTGYIFKTSDGFVHCESKEDSYFEIEDGVENMNAVKKLAGGELVPTLVDIRHAKGATKECRAYYTGGRSGTNT